MFYPIVTTDSSVKDIGERPKKQYDFVKIHGIRSKRCEHFQVSGFHDFPTFLELFDFLPNRTEFSIGEI